MHNIGIALAGRGWREKTVFVLYVNGLYGMMRVFCAHFTPIIFHRKKYSRKLGYLNRVWLVSLLLLPRGPDDDETARVNEGHRVSSKNPSLARAGEKNGARNGRYSTKYPNLGLYF